jgi:DNA-binding CsgD family transcriptional regulator
MRIEEFGELSGMHPMLYEVSGLIDACGLPEFEPLIAQVANKVLDCDHVTAFAFSDDGPPSVVCTSSISAMNPVKTVSDPYISRHWRRDPTNLFRTTKFRKDKLYVVFMSEDQVPDEGYRHDCYVMTGVKHRVSMLKWHRNGVIKLSFHRSADAGPFPHDCLDKLVPYGELLASVLLKHETLRTTPRQGTAAIEHYKSKIGLYCPELTLREREVCSLIAIGYSSEAIALTLKVSINTVLTFRRRAYSKLRISSQNEIMRILL